MLELITDRVQSDVALVKSLSKIKYSDMTNEQKVQWDSLLKGSYDYRDLNRVSDAMEYLVSLLTGYGYEVPGYSRVRIDRPDTPGESRLPDGYTELEYIESTGTQYIDTEFKPSDKTRVQIKFEPTNLTKTEWWFGVRSSSNTNMFGFYSSSPTSVQDTYASASKSFTVPDMSNSVVTLEKAEGVTKLTYNGETSVLQNEFSDFQSTLNLYLLVANLAGSAASTTRASGNLYSFDIYESNALVRQFVPCRNQLEEIGLFDLITAQFYSNSGTGEFTAGPEVVIPSIPDTRDSYTWFEDDMPTSTQMEQYRQNVSAIRSVLEVMQSTPSVPGSMDGLTAGGANALEQILMDVEYKIGVMETTFVACGPATCGGDYL